MSASQVLWCILVPPYAVRHKGCGIMLIVGLLWLCAWIPGSIAALLIVALDKDKGQGQPTG